MIRAKKSLGQNFLIDKNIIDKIIKTVPITNNEILEVGPGTGNLTKEILKNKPRKLFLVEKDTFLAESLKLIILFSILIDPEFGLSINDIKFKRVDFPEPEGPIKEYIFPFLNL